MAPPRDPEQQGREGQDGHDPAGGRRAARRVLDRNPWSERAAAARGAATAATARAGVGAGIRSTATAAVTRRGEAAAARTPSGDDDGQPCRGEDRALDERHLAEHRALLEFGQQEVDAGVVGETEVRERLAARGGSAADEASRDDVEFEAGPGFRCCGVEPCGEHEAGERSQRSGLPWPTSAATSSTSLLALA